MLNVCVCVTCKQYSIAFPQINIDPAMRQGLKLGFD